MKKLHTNQSGFTLIELLVVVGILAILMAVTIVAINPVQQFQNSRNAQRQSDVSSILEAIYQYEATNSGSLPGTIASMTAGTPYNLGTTGTNNIDLCQITSGSSILVPTHLADMPSDPQQASPKTPSGANCRSTTAYTTGYTLTKSATNNRLTVSAPLAENGATISVTR